MMGTQDFGKHVALSENRGPPFTSNCVLFFPMVSYVDSINYGIFAPFQGKAGQGKAPMIKAKKNANKVSRSKVI